MTKSSSWGTCECPAADVCPSFGADPDIAGVGVVSSFITSSCLAIIGTCLYLSIIRSGIVPDGSFDPPGLALHKSFNPIDGWARKTFCTPFVRFILKANWVRIRMLKYKSALFSFVLSLADMQLVTGIAMLSAAIIQLHNHKISIYHFSMVTEMAWLSSNVHLLALLAIRTEVIGSMKKGRRWLVPMQNNPPALERPRTSMGLGMDVFVRVVSMLISAALLLYCSYISGADGWDNHHSWPAHCAIGLKKSGKPRGWMVLNFVLVLWAYPERCLALWPAAGQWWIDKMRHRVLDNRGVGNSCQDQQLPLWRKIFVYAYYFTSSEAIQVLIDGIMWFGLGVFWIFTDRKSIHEWQEVKENFKEENDVEGFGQLVSILILGIPFLQALQAYCGQYNADIRKLRHEEQGGVGRLIWSFWNPHGDDGEGNHPE
ncbi:hypothetical protein FALBO_10376 [Fusarium albosuccineum]|uniref:Uncharacterized protein n=1 Tax=Fusarium albosuccineum TaxID=1237068 RepID=A0A8H4L7W2_9HYPO|nr:hypothetical protein FALBO_10376 [Fusarium albosuccineum]